uniref:FYVE-type domain-containing protein n=2 Tax=Phytophthora ramorum TaxID=164328 RepID=H3GHI2_PHYRM
MDPGSSTLGGIPKLQFSKERRQQLEATSDDLVDKALHVYDQFHTNKKHVWTSKHWKLVKRKKSLNIYRERGKSKTQDCRVYLCSGVMPGTVEDMLSGTYSDDTESMRISLGITTDKFLDARVLHVFEKNPATSSVVFSGIKWMALKTPTTASLIHDRDMLMYHRIGRIVDRQGRYFVYCVTDSIDLDEFPANGQANLERATISMCYLFRQVQEEWVGCFIMGSASMGGTLPRSVSELITAERMLSVGNLLVVARAKAYSARLASSAERIPSTSSSCDVCMKKPSMLSGSLKLCMGCRRNTCRKCRESCTVFRLELRTHKSGKEVFCSQCISEVTRPTMSNFYMCSLNESSSTQQQNFQSSSSVSSGFKHSSSSPSSSPNSHDFSESDSDAWLPAPPDFPENMEGFATFVGRASVANSKELQWNQEELDYFSGILRETGHLNPPQFSENSDSAGSSNSRRTNSYTKGFNPGGSMPPPSQDKPDRQFSRSYTTDDTSAPRDQKFFSVDELD